MTLARSVRTGLYGALQLVGSKTLDVAAQEIEVTGLNSDSDGDYFVVVNVKGNATGDYFKMFINGDATAGNYSNVHGRYYNTSAASSVSWSDAYISYAYNGGWAECRGWLTRKVGSGHVQGTMTGRYDDAGANHASTQNSIWYKVNIGVTSLKLRHNTAAGFAAGSSLKVYKIAAPASSVSSSASGEAIVKAYYQAVHGLVIGQPVYWNGTLWAPADSDAETTMCRAFVSTVVDANNIIVTTFGRMTATAPEWQARTQEGTDLVPGEYYFQSTVAGKITKNAPASGYSQCVGWAESTTTFFVNPGIAFALVQAAGLSNTFTTTLAANTAIATATETVLLTIDLPAGSYMGWASLMEAPAGALSPEWIITDGTTIFGSAQETINTGSAYQQSIVCVPFTLTVPTTITLRVKHPSATSVTYYALTTALSRPKATTMTFWRIG